MSTLPKLSGICSLVSENYIRGLTSEQFEELCGLSVIEHVHADLARNQRVHVQFTGEFEHMRVISEFLETELRQQRALGVEPIYGRTYISIEPTGISDKYHISAKIGLSLKQDSNRHMRTDSVRVYRSATTEELKEFLANVVKAGAVVLFDEGALRSDD